MLHGLPQLSSLKKDGSLRFCVKYRKENNVTQNDSYPLSRIEDSFERLSGATWFSTLIFISVYWQIDVKEKDRENITFDNFASDNSVSCERNERLMKKVLSGFICLVYLYRRQAADSPKTEVVNKSAKYLSSR